MQIFAKLAPPYDTKWAIFEFDVLVFDLCSIQTLTDPGQTEIQPYYYGNPSLNHVFNKFVPSQIECPVTYSCAIITGPAQIDSCDFFEQDKIQTIFNIPPPNPGESEFYIYA